MKDENLGYSLAVPGGWSELDLRSAQFQNLANTFGMGAQLGPLNDFLASPEGDALGVIYVTDLMSAMFGGLPTLLNVTVIDAPGQTPESLLTWLEGMIDANASMLGDATIESMETATINGLPAVVVSATANLASVGMNASVYAKVVALIANDKVYILTLASAARPTRAQRNLSSTKSLEPSAQNKSTRSLVSLVEIILSHSATYRLHSVGSISRPCAVFLR